MALSTSGDALTPSLLRVVAPSLDLVSLPLDGASEFVSRRTKNPGHRQAVWTALDRLRRQVMAKPHAVPIHWLDHRTLDRLYVMILPDGSLTVPAGPDYLSFGPFLELADFDAVVRASPFDSAKPTYHSRGWSRRHPERR